MFALRVFALGARTPVGLGAHDRERGVAHEADRTNRHSCIGVERQGRIESLQELASFIY